MNQSMDMNNDYSTCGFSRFPDGSKFKYDEDGEICLATDCSTWAKRLLNNLPFADYIESEEFVPPSEFLSFPEFGTLEKKKKGKKESIGNYIEDCEFCGEHMDETFACYIVEGEHKLICDECNDFVKREKCLLCKGRPNRYVEHFLNTKGVVPTSKCLCGGEDYCSTCWDNLTRLSNSYFNEFPEGRPYHSGYDGDLDLCPQCGDDSGGGLCYWCRREMMRD